MFGKLIPLAGGPEIPLLKKKITLGRHPASDIHIPFSNVSVNHCELIFERGVWSVVDLRSANGVRVNNARIEGNAAVLPGDTLTIARKHHFRLEYESEQAAKLAATPNREQDVFGKSLLEKAGLKSVTAPQAPRDDQP